MRDDGFGTLVKICAEAGGGSSHLGARSGMGCALRPPAHPMEHALRAAQRRDLQRLETRRKGALEALAGVVREDVLARREEPPDLGIALSGTRVR